MQTHAQTSQTGRRIDRLADGHAGRGIDRQKHADTRTDGQAGRQAGAQADTHAELRCCCSLLDRIHVADGDIFGTATENMSATTYVHDIEARETAAEQQCGQRNAFLERAALYKKNVYKKNDRFTKTGSGQT